MDEEKTVIARPQPPKPVEQPVPPPQPSEPPVAAAEPEPDDGKTVIARSVKPDPPAKKTAAKPKPAETKKPAANPVAKPGGGNGAVIALLVMALVLMGAGAFLVSIYAFSPSEQQVADTTESDLKEQIVAVTSPETEAEDEALVLAATKPRLLELSGDPIIVRQLGTAPRQLLKLEKEPQRAAAQKLGVQGDVFRMRDLLDVPQVGLQAGAIGDQSDIVTASASGEDGVAEDVSVITASDVLPPTRTTEFAKEIAAKQGLAAVLESLGMDGTRSKDAAQAFAKLHGIDTLEKGDRIAVRSRPLEDGQQPAPMQLSVYGADNSYVGSVALNDIETYVDAADPWYGADIFEAELLPTDIKPEDRPRLLDAIYAAGVRNRLPTPVIGEAIMLLSRAQDLEQKVETGDTVTLIYSPRARDSKTALGRIIFVSIGRSSGNLDCYVMQPQAGAQFECVAEGGGGSIDRDGMVTPVSGVIVSKFGAAPEAGGNTGEASDTNFGVDFAAPKGTPVVAAFAGQVQSAGPEDKFGTVVRLQHADGKATMYGYLQRIQIGVTPGAQIAAGQTIGFVGTPATSREARMHFEVTENGAAVDPENEMQAAAGGIGSAVGAVAKFVDRIIHIESANRCDARNPLSTAVGLGQFIESTWMTTIKIHRPDIFSKNTRAQVLAMRTNCQLARAMTHAFTADNAAVLRQRGHTVTPGNLYLAHFLGVGGAVKVLSNNQDRQIADVFGAAHVRANPFERGKSVGYLVSWAARKMAGKAPPPSADKPGKRAAAAKPGTLNANTDKTDAGGTANADASQTASPANLTQYAADPVFAQLKSSVVTLLQ